MSLAGEISEGDVVRLDVRDGALVFLPKRGAAPVA
jgi:hypothetical protein